MQLFFSTEKFSFIEFQITYIQTHVDWYVIFKFINFYFFRYCEINLNILFHHLFFGGNQE